MKIIEFTDVELCILIDSIMEYREILEDREDTVEETIMLIHLTKKLEFYLKKQN